MDVTSYLLGKQAGGGSTPTLQDKSVTITENGTTSVTADEGYDGLGEVDITTNVSGGGADEYFDTTITRNNFNKGLPSLILKKIPSNIVLPSRLTSLSEAFSNYYQLQSVPLFDTSNVTNMGSMFYGCTSLQSVPLFNTSNVTTMNWMFRDCSNLLSVPAFNTSKVTSFANMFNNCSLLTTLPVFDFSAVNNTNGLNYFVRSCGRLTDTSLDNILQSCVTATSFTGRKTLTELGFSDNITYPVSRIEALPHYQDFVNAGWSIGY
jgi:surface protein